MKKIISNTVEYIRKLAVDLKENDVDRAIRAQLCHGELEKASTLEDVNLVFKKYSDIFDNVSERLPTLGNLLEILKKELDTEEYNMELEDKPSNADITRLALKNAVYEYYSRIKMDQSTPAVSVYGDDRTIANLAPNKKIIFKLYCDTLNSNINSGDKFDVSNDLYDEILAAGIPKGGAFEKRLDRYREEFMKRLWTEFNNK